jgi:hypothetical protein
LAIEKGYKIIKHYSVPTTILAIVEVLESLSGKKYLAMKEGPMAGWLYRNLFEKVDCLIVSDPRRGSERIALKSSVFLSRMRKISNLT